MITVRFPTGVAIQYSEANFLRYMSAGQELYTENPDRGGTWVASIPASAGCIIEVRKPCRVYNTNHEPDQVVDALNRVLADPALRDRLPTDQIAEAKRRLGAFNAKRRTWKR